jgi:hypothetical protein
LVFNQQQPNFVMVITQMGIATMTAKGHTIHATFKFNLNGKPHCQQFIVINIEAFVGYVYWLLKTPQHVQEHFLDQQLFAWGN